LTPGPFNQFFPTLKRAVLGSANDRAPATGNWKAQLIFAKLEKKAAHRLYQRGDSQCSATGVEPDVHGANNVLAGQQSLIIGGGPCGLRTAIELQLLGAQHVLVVEKRDRISRNNVLHLWPFVIHDLKQLAGKKLYAKFCAGAIDHVSIRQLQLMLLKVALIVGCDYVDNVAFERICPHSIRPISSLDSSSKENLNQDRPSIDANPSDHSSSSSSSASSKGRRSGDCQCCCHLHGHSSTERAGALAHFRFNGASNHEPLVRRLNSYSFQLLIGADGRRNTLNEHFPRKEFRGRLAIAITANFINTHTLAEAQAPEISGISFIYYQQLFKCVFFSLHFPALILAFQVNFRFSLDTDRCTKRPASIWRTFATTKTIRTIS
jgi:hypothetical protein